MDLAIIPLSSLHMYCHFNVFIPSGLTMLYIYNVLGTTNVVVPKGKCVMTMQIHDVLTLNNIYTSHLLYIASLILDVCLFNVTD